MAKAVVWLLAGILALNAIALGALAVAVAIEARRRHREFRRLEWLRHIDADRPRGERIVVPFARAKATPRASRGSSSAARAVAILTVGAILCGGTAVASPHTRHAVASAFVAITQGLTTDPREPVDAAASDRSPSPSRTPARVAPRAPIVTLPSAQMGTARHHLPPSAAPAASSTSAAHVPVDVAPPPPEGVRAVAASSSEIDVSWTGVSGAAAYRVERSADGVGDWSTVPEAQTDDASLVDDGLDAGATYYYRVFSLSAERLSAASDIVSATTLLAAPPAPTVTATASSSSEILLSWSDVGDETGYRVERSTDGTTWTAIGTTGADITTYTDGGLAPGTTFSYRVFATNSGGDSPASEVVSATTPDASAVAATASLLVVPTA